MTRSQDSSPPPRRGIAAWKLALGGVAAVAVLLVGVVLAKPIRGGASLVFNANDAPAGDDDHGLWTCGMHPWVVENSPSDGCPICGMDLVPLDAAMFTGEVSIDPAIVQNIGVRVGRVTSGPLRREVRTVGSVVVDETRVSDVNTRFSGYIEELFVDQTGQQVEAGEPLFSVYSPELYAAADEYRLALRSAGDGATGVRRDLLDAAERRLQLLGLGEAEIARLSDDGDGRTVTLASPATGVVLDKMAVRGMRIEPGMRTYRIADLSRVWVQAAVYESDLPLIEVGQTATMTLSYLPGDLFEGAVTFVSPTLDARTRQGQVRLEFDNADGRLMPGMYADVTIAREAGEATLVDRDAILDTGRRRVAFVALGEGRFEPRDVTLGLDAADGRVQVLGGLSPGENVVTSGQFLLDSEASRRASLARMLGGGEATAAATRPAAAPVAETSTAALPADAAAAINDTLRPYLKIVELLGNDSADGAAALAQELETAAARMAPETPSLDAAALAEAAKQLRAAGDDLPAARAAFGVVSERFAPMLRKTGVPATFGGDVQALRCPMFPSGQTTPWLQAAGEPRNPYMGGRMPGCYDRDDRATLPTTPVAEASNE